MDYLSCFCRNKSDIMHFVMKILCISLLLMLSSASASAGFLAKCFPKWFGGSQSPVAAEKEVALEPQVEKLLENVGRSDGFFTIAVDLSRVTSESAEQIEGRLRERLNEMGDVLELSGSLVNGARNFERLLSQVQSQFPSANVASAGTAVYTLRRAILSILNSRDGDRYTTRSPLTLLVTDFVPQSPQYEDLSSLIRSMHGDRAMVEAFRKLRLVISSRFDINEWGSAQGGFNVGNHYRLGQP